MLRFALMLTILALVITAATVGTTRADTTTAPTKGCDAGEVLFNGVCGIPDMGFDRFKTWRTFHKYWAHEGMVRKCRIHTIYHFKADSRDIRPWQRLENLSAWKRRHSRVQHKSSVCLPSNPRDLGKYLASKRYGWTGYQWEALDAIIMRESSWNPCRHYPSTTNCNYAGPSACGIPQANPCSKLLVWCGANSIGTCPAYNQIIWTLDYIRGRYGSPATALANGSTY